MLGTMELILILGVAVLLFGPSKLPQLGGAIGECVRNFRKAVDSVDKEIDSPKLKKIEDPSKAA